MAGFRKAKTEQAALKVGFYGPPGSGKTFTALLCAEGLAKLSGKRIAYVDTEHGTDFYCQAVPERYHPEAFDFDALYTRSITEISKSIAKLNPSEHCCLVIDSITHVWEAARLAYAGRLTKAGTIPFNAWAQIKKPYKEIMSFLLSTPLHVFILGRQGNEFEEDEETQELKKVGVKMKAEGETAYEPHILLRMEAVKKSQSDAVITAYAEKDRTGILSGKTIQFPNFDSLIKPLLPLLGEKQAVVEDPDAVAAKDAEALSQEERDKEKDGQDIMDRMCARIALCANIKDLKDLGKEITPELKRRMTPQQVTALREKYLEAEGRLK